MNASDEKNFCVNLNEMHALYEKLGTRGIELAKNHHFSGPEGLRVFREWKKRKKGTERERERGKFEGERRGA